jgi:serine protease
LRRIFSRFGVFTTTVVMFAAAGCNGDRPAITPVPPPPATEGTISGQLLVPPNQQLEVEPNETLNQAQDMGRGVRLAGTAAVGDAGFPLAGVNAEAQDLYRLNTSRPVRVTLTIGANDLLTYDPVSQTITEIINDLDLVLLDDQGNVVTFSEGLIRNETIDVPTPGEYFIGVRAAKGASPYVVAVDPVLYGSSSGAPPPAAAAVFEDLVPGEVLMKQRTGSPSSMQKLNEMARSNGAIYVKTLPPSVDVLKVALSGYTSRLQLGLVDSKLDPAAIGEHFLRAATAEVVARLQADPDVAWAQPNYLRKPQIVPTDELYSKQWHYEQINLPDAWDTTTGSDNIIVAVLDTGILSDHPDLAGRLIAGYDFVSDPTRAQDGDALDPDAEDPGDDPNNQSSSFHGTHVAGTIGASTNNGIGVAGVTWQTRIMPVRVLGAHGGTSAEVAQGIRFAAGLPNESGTLPGEAAHVINMSLSGVGISPVEQEAVTAARGAGTVVIAAAGNDNSPGEYSPASLDGVISVSAVGATGNITPYSNYGATIDVAAPGGEFFDADNDDNPDMVLSTLGDDAGNYFYNYYQGTSMASPHVAGVVALMLAVNPALTPDDIDMLLAGTHPDTSTRITRDLGRAGRDNYYGHGLIDAAAAVLAAGEVAGGGGPGPGSVGSRLSVFPASLEFRNYLRALPLDVSNGGAGRLNITSVTSDASWLVAAPTSGEAPLTIDVSVDRSGLVDGSYSGTIQIQTDASDGESTETVNIAMTVGGLSSGDVGQTIVRLLSEDGSQILQEVVTDASQDYSYAFTAVGPGTYVVKAGTDRDGDNVICDIEDACGFAPTTVIVNASGDGITGVVILVTSGSGQQTLPIDNESQ